MPRCSQPEPAVFVKLKLAVPATPRRRRRHRVTARFAVGGKRWRHRDSVATGRDAGRRRSARKCSARSAARRRERHHHSAHRIPAIGHRRLQRRRKRRPHRRRLRRPRARRHTSTRRRPTQRRRIQRHISRTRAHHPSHSQGLPRLGRRIGQRVVAIVLPACGRGDVAEVRRRSVRKLCRQRSPARPPSHVHDQRPRRGVRRRLNRKSVPNAPDVHSVGVVRAAGRGSSVRPTDRPWIVAVTGRAPASRHCDERAQLRRHSCLPVETSVPPMHPIRASFRRQIHRARRTGRRTRQRTAARLRLGSSACRLLAG